MSYEDVERRIVRMLEEVETESEYYDDISDISYSFMESVLRNRYTSSTVPQTIKLRIKEILNISENVASSSNQNLRIIGRCNYCDRKKNRKTKYSCFKCGKHMCLEHVTAICQECALPPDIMDTDDV